MAEGRYATILRLGKPIVAGLALAYLVTAFVDRPAPVHFQPGNPYAAQQSAIIEPETTLVVEKNIMKLGSPLSMMPDEGMTDTNPLAVLEEFDPPAEVGATGSGAAATSVAATENATRDAPVAPAEIPDAGDTVPTVRGEVDTIQPPVSATP